jgi:hypothetical protein
MKTSQGLICLVSKLKKIYRQRINRNKSREANNNLRFDSIQNIRNLFTNNSSSLNPQSIMVSPWLSNCYKPFDFSTIVGQPHDLPKSLGRLSIFHGDNGISANDHWDAFMDFIRNENVQHLDVLFKWFTLSLKKNA